MEIVFRAVGGIAIVFSLLWLIDFDYWWASFLAGVFMIGFGSLLSGIDKLTDEVKKLNRAAG